MSQKDINLPSWKSHISTASRLVSSKHYSPPYLTRTTLHLWGNRIAYLLPDMIHSWIKGTICKQRVLVLCANSKFTATSFKNISIFSDYRFPVYPIVISLLRTIYWISFVPLISVKFQTPYKCMWLLNLGKRLFFFEGVSFWQSWWKQWNVPVILLDFHSYFCCILV